MISRRTAQTRFASHHNIRLAVLEETGHISAIAADQGKPSGD